MQYNLVIAKYSAEKMTDWQRLEQVICWTGLSTNAFAAGIGLRRSENLYQIKRGNNGISKDLAELIVAKYPSLNRAWLLTGDGEMFAAASCSADGKSGGGIPLYNTDAVRLAAVPDEGLAAAPAHWIDVPGFGDCDFAGVATGDAMAPEVPAGAIVALKRVDPMGPVMPGEIYVAVTADFAAMGYLELDRKVADGLWFMPPEGVEVRPMGAVRGKIRRLYLVKGIIVHKVL